MSFGRNLSRFRKEKGLTQIDLVKKSHVAISQIRRYEADKSSPIGKSGDVEKRGRWFKDNLLAPPVQF